MRRSWLRRRGTHPIQFLHREGTLRRRRRRCPRDARRHGYAGPASPDDLRPGFAASHRIDSTDGNCADRLGQAGQSPIPGLPADRQWAAPTSQTALPTADPGTHTAQIRLDLPATVGNLAPGTFARVVATDAGFATPRLYVPPARSSGAREMTGAYVLDAKGHPILRQVRLGVPINDRVEVLSGVSAGERVALDPQAAAREH